MSDMTYTTGAWSLEDLFDTLGSAEIETAMESLEQQLKTLETVRSSLTPDISSDTFNDILSQYEQMYQHMYRIYGFGTLSFAENTQNQTAQAYLGRVGQLAAEAQNRTLFFSLWWKELDNANAERLLDDAGKLRYWLQKVRMSRPFTLSEVEEKVVNLKNVNGSVAMSRLYASITNRYKFNIDQNGETQPVNREQLSINYRSNDPDLRKQAYTELFRVYGDDSSILGQIYQSLMRDWYSENVQLRGYDRPISVRNRSNDVPDQVVETLLAVVRKNAPIFHRFFKLKAEWLGVEKLRRYDLYAPVVQTSKQYTFNDAVRMVLDSFGEFDPRISALAERVFTDQHYHSSLEEGKRGGAFCATLGPKYTPWVLQTFTGEPRDVATMAHELGHAVHSLLAEHHSVLTQQASLPLAETASTFGEMLLLDKMLATDPDPNLQRDLLFSNMDDAYATIMRQAYFAIFEVEAHDAIQRNASVDELSDIYLTMLREQFGEAVDVTDDFRYEWVAIPHFYSTPFYVYAYAFGQLLALALYKQYKEEGDSMIPRYIEILAAGGSEAPVTVLRNAGINIYDEAFWQGGFDYLAAQLEALELLPVPAQA